MTKDEALKLALEAITTYLSESPDPSEEAVEGLCDAASVARRTLAQPAPVQEPDQQGVDAVNTLTEENWIRDGDQWQRPPAPENWIWDGNQWQRPPAPQRTWVGLTQEEKDSWVDDMLYHVQPWHLMNLVNVIETKLKEKNA
jgi:hypothetical protein